MQYAWCFPTDDNGGPALVADGSRKVKIRYSSVAHTRAIAVLHMWVVGRHRLRTSLHTTQRQSFDGQYSLYNASAR
jgi:hypothetical protein